MTGTINLIGQFSDSGRVAHEQSVRFLLAEPYPYLIYCTVEGAPLGSVISTRRARIVEAEQD